MDKKILFVTIISGFLGLASGIETSRWSASEQSSAADTSKGLSTASPSTTLEPENSALPPDTASRTGSPKIALSSSKIQREDTAALEFRKSNAFYFHPFITLLSLAAMDSVPLMFTLTYERNYAFSSSFILQPSLHFGSSYELPLKYSGWGLDVKPGLRKYFRRPSSGLYVQGSLIGTLDFKDVEEVGGYGSGAGSFYRLGGAGYFGYKAFGRPPIALDFNLGLAYVRGFGEIDINDPTGARIARTKAFPNETFLDLNIGLGFRF